MDLGGQNSSNSSKPTFAITHRLATSEAAEAITSNDTAVIYHYWTVRIVSNHETVAGHQSKHANPPVDCMLLPAPPRRQYASQYCSIEPTGFVRQPRLVHVTGPRPNLKTRICLLTSALRT